MPDAWYVACASEELKGKPIARTILGVPLALFRNADGAVGAVLDRCPHRNVPLSMGRVEGKCLECPYHGWQFTPDGEVVRVPGLRGEVQAKARNVEAWAAVEQEGYVWV